MSPLASVIAGGRRRAGGAPVYVGYNTIGGSTATLSLGNITACAKFTAPFTGTISEFDFYCACSGVSRNLKFGLYTDAAGSPNTRVGSEIEFASIGIFSAQWKNFGGFSLPVTSGQDYWLCVSCNQATGVSFHYDTAGAGRKTDNHTYGNAWPATFTVDSSSGAQYSLRALLTP